LPFEQQFSTILPSWKNPNKKRGDLGLGALFSKQVMTRFRILEKRFFQKIQNSIHLLNKCSLSAQITAWLNLAK